MVKVIRSSNHILTLVIAIKNKTEFIAHGKKTLKNVTCCIVVITIICI